MKTICPLYTWAGNHLTINARIDALGEGDLAIVNPNNGPGPYDHDVALAIERLKGRKVKVLGYVHLDWGRRTLGAVFADIALWRREYNVREIFFDEAPADGLILGLLWGAVRGYSRQDPLMVANTGVSRLLLPEGYYPPAKTIIVTYEGKGLPPAPPEQPWEATIVWGSDNADRDRQALKAMNAKYAYVTDDGEPGDLNPYDEPSRF